MGDIPDILDALSKASPVAIVVVLILVVLAWPEKVERASGWFLGLFAWAGTAVRRRSAKGTIQGQIGGFAKAFDKQVRGAMPFSPRIKFVKDVDRAELQPDKQTVIVRLRDRLQDDRNLVHAMLVFCTQGVVPQARAYLSPSLSEAIDFTVTRKLLTGLRHFSALTYLDGEALRDACEANPELKPQCERLDSLDEDGLFARVVLAELRDFGAAIESRQPSQAHALEAESFIEYVYRVASRRPGESLGIPGHIGRYIKTAFVFVGRGYVMDTEGATPYLNHVRRLRQAGFERAYLAGRGAPISRNAILAVRRRLGFPTTRLRDDPGDAELERSLEMVERVAYLVEHAKLAKKRRTMDFVARDSNEVDRTTRLVELDLRVEG